MGLLPRIGITPEERDARGNIILPREYPDAVARAGGLALILPPWGADPAQLLAAVDGLILAGGGDIDPAAYGGAYHPEVYAVDPERDTVEIALVRMAVTHGIPLLGICRGAQVVNVALGGTLVEHLDDEASGEVRHRGDPPAYTPHHVEIAAGSHLARIAGCLSAEPLSWHHQAIRAPAPRVRVAAWARDGVVEAIELADHPFLIAVQWHPEMSAAGDVAQQRLFDGLVDAARRRVTTLASAAAPLSV